MKGGNAGACRLQPASHPIMNESPEALDRLTRWYRQRGAYDLDKLTKARLKKIIEAFKSPKSYQPYREALPEKDFPYETWRFLTDGVLPIRLRNGKDGVLLLGQLDSDGRYRGAQVLGDDPIPSTQKLNSGLDILAALVATEERRLDPDDVWRAYQLRNALFEHVSDPEGLLERVHSDPSLGGASPAQFKDALYGLLLPEALLRNSRPGFDELPETERVELVKQVRARIEKLLNGLWELQDFLKRGTTQGMPKHRVADQELDVRAAELRDATGLSYREIAEVLEVPLTESQKIKVYSKRIFNMVDRGRKVLVRALGGEAGYQAHLKAIKPDLDHFLSFDIEERRKKLGGR